MPEALKDMFFKSAYFDALNAAIQSVYPAFDAQTFVERVHDDRWEGRALKERIRHITIVLYDLLPADYRTALDILRRAAAVLEYRDFGVMIFPDFVELYGLDDWEPSLPALEQFTQMMSAEFAVRPFIARDPARMMAQMDEWSRHKSASVRRLASEGCRPRLPWGMALNALKADPTPILPILERLKDDESEDVRRSVSNNLNDISKDNPQVVIDVARRWLVDDKPEVRAIVSHALRTLVKKGDPAALELLGYGGSGSAAVNVNSLTVDPLLIPIGSSITLSFELESLGDEPQNLMIDYVIYHMRANGKQTPKVFKLTKKVLAPGERTVITRRHSFEPVTTRKYYPGAHAIEIQVNGARVGRFEFTLTEG